MPYGLPASIIGAIVSGDLGPSTIYTDRFGKKVEYPRSPPKQPPSPGQLRIRHRFRQAQAAYMQTTPAEKQAWEHLSRKLSICQTGQNLYIHFAIVHDFDALQTLIRQSGVNVTPPLSV